MHLGIDVREAGALARTGKGTWVFQFVRALLKRGTPLTLFSNKAVPAEWGKNAPCEIIEQGGFRWHWHVSTLLTQKRPVDVYISPTSYIVPAILSGTFPCVPVVHDLIAFRGEPHGRRATIIERLTLKRAVRHAPFLFTISEQTKLDLLSKYPFLSPKRTRTIYAGPTVDGRTLALGDEPTILCIGTLSPRKNQIALIRAYRLLPEDLRKHFRLILVGSRGWMDEDVVQEARETQGVEWQGYLPDAACQSLLAHCTLLALPSLYEGFGLPILDAMTCGVPVLTSDRGSLKEVAGDAALFIDPTDVASIASGLEVLLRDAGLRESLKMKGKKQASTFTWERTADVFLSALENINRDRITPC